MSKNLIINYSRKGENYVNGSIVDLKMGNTEICTGAKFGTGGDGSVIKRFHQKADCKSAGVW